jgi:single-stranded-DNA-specific exonuclease
MDSEHTSGVGPPAGRVRAAVGDSAGSALPARAWRLAPELPLADLDAAAPDVTRLQTQMLANRGVIGAAAVRAFLAADWHATPPALLGLDVAVERLRRAHAQGERVVVYGDFDADGLTSCAVMLLALRRCGIAAEYYVPSRTDEGRGLNDAAVRRLAAQGIALIVTTDCGTANVAEVRLAASLGMDVIVTDHHPPQGEIAPAHAVVNPRRPGCPSREKNLAGVGVAFRVAEALLAEMTDAAVAATALSSFVELVALGTIGDVAPLTSENWTLTHAGLARLNTQPRAGLRALAEVIGLRVGTITERDISFALAPRLNAAGRMGDPMLALRLLVTDDPAEGATLARELQRHNEERQRATDAMMAEARAQVLAQGADAPNGGPAVIAAYGEGWPLGIIGLVAGRLAEEFGRPALVASVNGSECRGSIRGPEGTNLVETLAQRAEWLRHFGGHAQAAGFTIARADLQALIEHLRVAVESARGVVSPAAVVSRDTVIESALAPDELAADIGDTESPTADVDAPAAPLNGPAEGAPELLVDCRLPLRSVTPETYSALRRLGPFGPGFPPPVFLAPRVRVARCWRSGPEGRNLRVALRDGTSERVALWKGQGALQPMVRAIAFAEVVYTLDSFPRADGPAELIMRVLALRPIE